LRIGLVGVLQVIGRQRRVRGRERGSDQVRQLFGGQLHRQPERACPIEHPSDLFGREGDACAEAVHGIDEPHGMRLL